MVYFDFKVFWRLRAGGLATVDKQKSEIRNQKSEIRRKYVDLLETYSLLASKYVWLSRHFVSCGDNLVHTFLYFNMDLSYFLTIFIFILISCSYVPSYILTWICLIFKSMYFHFNILHTPSYVLTWICLIFKIHLSYFYNFVATIWYWVECWKQAKFESGIQSN